MKLFRVLGFALILAGVAPATFGLGSSGRAAGTAVATHESRLRDKKDELKRALKGLQKVREELMKASKDYGGHRTKAVESIDAAMDEIKQALALDK